MLHAPKNFADVIHARAQEDPARDAYHFLAAGSAPAQTLTRGAVLDGAERIGAALGAAGLKDARVVLSLPHGPDFLIAFFGCIVAGAVAVPVPQSRKGQDDRRFASVVADCTPAMVLCEADMIDTLRGLAGEGPAILTVSQLAAGGGVLARPNLTRDDLAIIQYTSGSTGDPKGVMITHGNFLDNSALIQQAARTGPHSRSVMWLPFYHDMGLVGAVLQPIYCGGLVTLMSPQAFMRSPTSWIKALSDHRATMATAPNFALELVCDRFTPEQVAALDLSPLEVVLCGSEPVIPGTLDRFTRTFAAAGFRRETFLPAYGLAEGTLYATGALRDGTGPHVVTVDAQALSENRVAPVGTGQSQRLVGNGPAEDRVRIVDPVTCLAVPAGQVGEIWLTGSSIAQGYWNKPAVNARVFGQRLANDPQAGPYFRTGDLGFVQGEDLYITGRIKDLIIIRGRNHYPQDIEETASRGHDVVATGAAAAFSVERGFGEEIILAVEVTRTGVTALKSDALADQVMAEIRRQITDVHELALSEIRLIKPMRLVRTSSGKIQRHAVRADWQAGALDDYTIAVWQRPATSFDADAPRVPLKTRPEVEAWLIARLAQAAGVPAHDIALDAPFASYGLDSLTAVELVWAINDRIPDRLPIDPTDLFNYPTIESLMNHIFDGDAALRADKADGAAEAELDLEAEVAALRKLLGD